MSLVLGVDQQGGNVFPGMEREFGKLDYLPGFAVLYQFIIRWMRIGAVHRSGDRGDEVRHAGGVEITVERVESVGRRSRPAPLANGAGDRQEHLPRITSSGAVEGGLQNQAIPDAGQMLVVRH